MTTENWIQIALALMAVIGFLISRVLFRVEKTMEKLTEISTDHETRITVIEKTKL